MKDITNYVRIYSDYQKMRIHYYKPYKKLSLILSNNVISFHIMTLNFITNMLFVRSLNI